MKVAAILWPVVVACAAALLGVSANGSPKYAVQDLGAAYEVKGLNNGGEVVGSILATSDPHAFLWSDGDMQDLGTLGGAYSHAFAINDSGQVVGCSTTSDTSGYRSFLWESGVMTDIGTLGGKWGNANSINSTGQIAGVSYPPNETSDYRAFLYDGVEMLNLGTLGGDCSNASDINDLGQVVGHAYIAGQRWRGFLWEDGSMYDLGVADVGGDTFANAINNLGQIVGEAVLADYTSHACIWEDGVIRLLGSLRGSTYACDINDSGQIVGYSSTACLWENGAVYDLNSLIAQDSGWRLDIANAINGSGQIAGTGQLGGVTHAYLLTPVPEPSSVFVLVCGLSTVGAMLRLRNRTSRQSCQDL